MNKKHLFILCLLWATCIAANAEEIPNDEIWYTASSKLLETEYAYPPGIYTNAFNTTISSHTFTEGKGVIKFNGDVTSIGERAFNQCSGMTSVTIPNSVTSIGEWAFNQCSGMTSVTIPNSVMNIGYRAFSFCSGLTSVTIGNSVTSIGEEAFEDCSSLTSITIPNSVKSIGEDAFYNCSSLASITIGNSVASIGEWAFSGCSGLISITIPNSVTSIGYRAFWGCSSLTSVIIPNSVANIGEGAFGDCYSIETISVSSDNPYFADYGCNVIVNISTQRLINGCKNSTIPSSVTSIGGCAFYGCSSLTSITIPKSVTSIENSAFAYCSGLQSVKVSWSRPLSNGDIFNGIDYSTCILYVPKGTATLYMVAPYWIKFTNIQEYSDGEEEYVISIKQGDAGCVKDVVEVGKTAQYIITPAEGWSVNSVSFNGRDVTNSLIEGRYTTPVITGNSELNVVFKQEGSGVKDLINSNVKVLASNGSVIVSGNGNNGPVVVYSVGGAEVASDSGNCNIHLNAGIYIVKVGTEVFKVAL